MASRKSRNIYIPKCFMAVRNCMHIFVLLTCSCIGELLNDRKFKCGNKSFIIFVLIVRKVLF